MWVYTDLQITTIADAKIEGGDLDLKYFLMALYYLRKYPTEEDLTADFDFSNYWARKKTWGAIERIRLLKHKVITWEENYQSGKRWVISVDGIHSRRKMGDSNDVCPPWRLALELLQQRSKQKRRMKKEPDKNEG